MAQFDLIIVGTGVTGRTAAEEAAAAGLSTALVDCRPFGGTCALRGCEPKKVLFAAAETIRRARRQTGHGVAGAALLDWGELVAFKRGFTEPLPSAFEAEFTGLGVMELHGVARFIAPDSIEVAGATHTAKAFLLATGAVPAPLEIVGEDLVVDSERFMELAELPERIVFIGGGFVSFELAGIAAAVGSHCTILHRSARPLAGFDPDLVDLLVAQYVADGVDVRVNAPVVVVSRAAASVPGRRPAFVVELSDGSAVVADLVVHGAGRVPYLEQLDLNAANVAFGRRGIEVDSGLRSTSNPRVYAAGDAAALGPPLTPVGVAQARVAVRNIVAPGSAEFDPVTVPSAVFSQPPLASVGLTEQAARSGSTSVAVKFTDTSQWLSSQRVGLSHTAAKVVLDEADGRVLGAHVLGHNAEELINLFAIAIARGLTAAELKGMLWAYPTASSEIVYLV